MASFQSRNCELLCTPPGGRGTIVGTTLGVIFMTLVGNSFSIFEIGAYWQDVIVGALLIIVVCVDAYINILRQRGNRVRI